MRTSPELLGKYDALNPIVNTSMSILCSLTKILAYA